MELKSIRNYIDGQFVSGKREFADLNPADGSVIAQVTEADQALVDDAVRAARKAVRGEWGRLAIRERAARLHKVADIIEERFDRFVEAEVADTGKPVALASRLDVPKYSMVTFHRIPYATALKRGQLQDRMLTDLCDPINRIEDLDWSKAERLIRSELTPLELVS